MKIKMAMATCIGRRILVQFSVATKFQNITITRSNHTSRLNAWTPSGVVLSQNLYRTYRPLIGIASVRCASQGTDSPTAIIEAKSAIVIDESLLPPIPVPPVDEAVSVASEAVTNIAGEPGIATYGLGGWSPVGLAQQGLEYIHVTLDVPWWGTIVIGTIVLRMLVFPLVVKAQRNAAKMANNFPQLQRIQDKMTQARQEGNKFEAARLGQEMMVFMKEKKLNPIANILPPLAQAPLFISMFMGLRGMSSAPVESFQTGGMLWFTDLTVPDQYFLLPIITSLTFALTIEMGTDSARASSLGMMRYALRAMPIIIFPFTMNFPGAVLCYWVSTNFISLIQVSVLRIPKIRNYFQIEPIIIHAKGDRPVQKGFVKGFKESMTNMKITRELNERENIDTVNFQRAGRAPIRKTFKHDPTIRSTGSNELLAKRKEQ